MPLHSERLQSPGQQALVRAWKRLDEKAAAAVIEITNEAGTQLGTLTPITSRDARDTTICESLTRWRRLFRKNFITQFDPTPERTRRWLEEVVLVNDTRILFLIRDEQARPIGNFGVCNISSDEAELDNLIRGEKGGDAHLIYFAELALLHWVFTELNVSLAYLHVFNSNLKTIGLHESVGFLERSRTPLARVEHQGEVTMTTEQSLDSEATGIDLVRMELSQTEFASRYPWKNLKGEPWTR